MKKINVLHAQSFLDLAVMHTGDAGNAYALARFNQKSISEDLEAGSEIGVPKDLKLNTTISDYYATKGIQPATGQKLSHLSPQGIGFWRVGTDFIIN